MRRLLLALLLCAAPLRAQVTYNTSASNSDAASGNPIIVTLAIPSGKTTVVGICMDRTTGGGAQVVSAVADSLGSSVYTFQDSITDAGDTNHIELWSTAAGASTAASGVKVTLSGNAYWDVFVAVYNGVAALGLKNSGNANSGTSSAAITTQDANNYVVSTHCAYGHGNGQTLSAATGNLRQSQNSTGSKPGSGWVDNTAASASSVTVSATLSTAARWDADALELRSTTGGGGGGAQAGGWIP